MGVPWDFASTEMLVVLEGVTQVCEEPQSLEGGHPPQVPPQPSLPHVFPVQSELHAVPPSDADPDDDPADPLDPAPDDDPADPLDPAPDDDPADPPDPAPDDDPAEPLETAPDDAPEEEPALWPPVPELPPSPCWPELEAQACAPTPMATASVRVPEKKGLSTWCDVWRFIPKLYAVVARSVGLKRPGRWSGARAR